MQGKKNYKNKKIQGIAMMLWLWVVCIWYRNKAVYSIRIKEKG